MPFGILCQRFPYLSVNSSARRVRGLAGLGPPSGALAGVWDFVRSVGLIVPPAGKGSVSRELIRLRSK